MNDASHAATSRQLARQRSVNTLKILNNSKDIQEFKIIKFVRKCHAKHCFYITSRPPYCCVRRKECKLDPFVRYTNIFDNLFVVLLSEN